PQSDACGLESGLTIRSVEKPFGARPRSSARYLPKPALFSVRPRTPHLASFPVQCEFDARLPCPENELSRKTPLCPGSARAGNATAVQCIRRVGAIRGRPDCSGRLDFRTPEAQACACRHS